MPVLWRNIDQKSIETVFLIAISRRTGDKWQSKTRFLSIFDPRSFIVDSVFYCRLPGVNMMMCGPSQKRIFIFQLIYIF